MKEFRRRLEKIKFEKQEKWQMEIEFKKIMKEATTKKITKTGKGKRKRNKWCDRESDQLKKEVIKRLRK